MNRKDIRFVMLPYAAAMSIFIMIGGAATLLGAPPLNWWIIILDGVLMVGIGFCGFLAVERERNRRAMEDEEANADGEELDGDGGD